jgi:TRAP-type C4-dicarboxylate transport system substrate-binding protein
MFTRQTISAFLVVSMLFLLPCIGIASSETRKLTIKFSSSFMADDHRTRTYEYWANLVNTGTNGRVEVVVFKGGSLIPQRDHYQSIIGGGVGAAMLVSSQIVDNMPELLPATIEGFVPMHGPQDLVWVEKALNPVMVRIHEKYNMRYLFPTYEGVTCWIVRKGLKPVLKVEDLRGMKIRALGNFAKIVSKLGASPIILDLSQLVPALNYGTIDAASMNDSAAVGIKVWEVAPNLTYPGTGSGSFVYTAMNLDMFKSLSKEDQQILVQAAEKATEYSAELGKQSTADFLANPRGFKIHYLPKEETEKYKEAIKAVAEEVFKGMPPLGRELADLLERIKK